MAVRMVPSAMAALLLVASFLLLAPTGQAEAPAEAVIESFTYMGSGCPGGSAVGEISKDGLVLTMKFAEFSASTDAGENGKRKNCQINLKVKYPEGWSYGLEMVTLRGYARLDDKVKGIHKVHYYFAGDSGSGKFAGETVGEHDANYEHSGPFTTPVYSPCDANRNLNINMQVQVNNTANPTGQGFIDVDTADTTIVTVRMKWNTCP